MTVAALAAPYLDGPTTRPVCHILHHGAETFCGRTDHGPVCDAAGTIWTVCPDCGLDACERCRVVAVAWLAAKAEA